LVSAIQPNAQYNTSCNCAATNLSVRKQLKQQPFNYGCYQNMYRLIKLTNYQKLKSNQNPMPDSVVYMAVLTTYAARKSTT